MVLADLKFDRDRVSELSLIAPQTYQHLHGILSCEEGVGMDLVDIFSFIDT